VALDLVLTPKTTGLGLALEHVVLEPMSAMYTLKFTIFVQTTNVLTYLITRRLDTPSLQGVTQHVSIERDRLRCCRRTSVSVAAAASPCLTCSRRIIRSTLVHLITDVRISSSSSLTVCPASVVLCCRVQLTAAASECR